jgi:hypothetical protein
VLFELISARYERCSLLITANQPFGESVVMRHQLRLRARHLGKAILQQLCHLLVILLPGALQQRLVSRILDQRMLEARWAGGGMTRIATAAAKLS